MDIQADQNNENCVSDNAYLERTYIEIIHNDSDSLHDFNILHASDVSANSSMRSLLCNTSHTTAHDITEQKSSCDATNLGLKGKGLRIGHINIQGLSNKVDQLKYMLQSDSNRIHMFGISETKLNDYHADSVFEIN